MSDYPGQRSVFESLVHEIKTIQGRDCALTIEQQAAAYRFLRECCSISSAHAAISVRCPKFDNDRLVDPNRELSGKDLDAYIMALVEAKARR
jgi:hypothetical protein